jgi:glycosyltransferase involved in cell wall biosynthesis
MPAAGTAERGLRIALLHPCYWPEVRRGSERLIHDLGVRLAEHGDSPRLITSHPGQRSESVEEGMEVLRLHRPRGRRLQIGLRDQYLTHVPGTLRALRATDPDVVHALYPVDAAAAARWSHGNRRPLVFSLMGMPRPEALRRRIWRSVVARALRRADVSVCLSRRAADLTADTFGVDARVIHPGVDLDVFRPTAPRAEAPTILCPADLGDPRKRGPLLLDAFAVFRSQRPGARLVLSRPAGGSAPPAESGVEYAVLDSEEALARAYSEAWLTVLLSESEAFGLVFTESLACGTPVLGARGGGAAEIVDSDAVGRVLDSEDPVQAAELMAEAMAAGEDARQACRSRAGDFSADRCAESYEALYRELIAR